MGTFSTTDEGAFNPLTRSRYSDFCPVTNKSVQKNTTRRTLLSSTSRAKGEKDWPHESPSPRASPPARRPEASGRLTASTMSRNEIAVPCTHQRIWGMTHNVIIAEYPNATPLGP